jgi:hypothetical protein
MVKPHGGLYACFVAGGDEDAVEAAMSPLPAVRFKGVLACGQRGEAVGAVSGCGGVRFVAGGAVAQDYGSAGQWSRMQIGEFAGKGTAGSGLGKEGHTRAKKKHG